MFLGVSEIKCLEFASIHRSKSLLGWINGCRQVLSSWGCCISGPKVSKARGNRTVETKSSCRLLSCRDISVKPHWNSKGKCDNARLGTVQKHGHQALCCHWSLNGFTRASAWLWGVLDFTNTRRLHSLTQLQWRYFFQELDIHPTYLNISIWWRMKALSEHTRKKTKTKNSILLCLKFYLNAYIAYKCIQWTWSRSMFLTFKREVFLASVTCFSGIRNIFIW